MYAREAAKQEVLSALRKYLEVDISLDDIETPPDEALGDFAYPLFSAAKQMKRNPAELATELAAKIGPSELIENVKAKGAYVNFQVSPEVFVTRVLEEVLTGKGEYGTGTSGEGKKIIVDYAQPNTHKEFHVGHIRNAVLGQSLIHVLRANGYEVIGASYIGDIGAHVAKALWGMQKFGLDGKDTAKEDRARLLGEIYTKTTAYLETHEEEKEEVAQVHRALEAKEEPWYTLWRKTREWSLESFKRIFKDLGVKPDVWYFESEVEEEGKRLVHTLLTQGIAKKSEGAVVVDLEDEGLGVMLALKSDGSSLYATKDLFLAQCKEKDHHADRQVFVVDVRQSLYFKQLFATLKRMGFEKQLVHLGYDMVKLPQGAMSSRAGNIVTSEALKEQLYNELAKETRARHEDWPEDQVKKVANEIALGSMSFMMLRQDPGTMITFDMQEAVSFDGFTAPYLLYTVARIYSLERKAKRKAKQNAALLTHPVEIAMCKKLAQYPDVVERAGFTFAIHGIATWAFELSQLFNEYYHEVRIMDDENVGRLRARLALVGAIRIGLSNALELLTIKPLKEM